MGAMRALGDLDTQKAYKALRAIAVSDTPATGSSYAYNNKTRRIAIKNLYHDASDAKTFAVFTEIDNSIDLGYDDSAYDKSTVEITSCLRKNGSQEAEQLLINLWSAHPQLTELRWALANLGSEDSVAALMQAVMMRMSFHKHKYCTNYQNLNSF